MNSSSQRKRTASGKHGRVTSAQPVRSHAVARHAQPTVRKSDQVAHARASAKHAKPTARASARTVSARSGAHAHARASAGGKRKVAVLAVSLVLVAAIGIGGVVAWLVATADPVKNTFVPVTVTCAVDESFDQATKADVRVKNTSPQGVSVNMRAMIVVNWTNAAGDVYSMPPVLGTDYSMTIPTGSGWTLGADGIYYYANIVPSGGYSSYLITEAKPLRPGPAGYTLSVDVLAEAIQADGDAAGSSWTSAP